MLPPARYSPFMLLRFFVVALVSLCAFFMGHTPMIQAQTPSASDQSSNDDILFLSQREGRWKAYIMNVDGSNQRLVTTRINFPRSFIAVYSAVFSPDRTQIILAVKKIDSTIPGQEHRLYRVNADGKDLKLLWSGTGDYLSPVWSPDGNQVLFTGLDDSGSDLYVINSDGSGLKRLTEGRQSQFDSRWSPSGLQILFVSRIEGNSALSVINADGTGFRELASGDSDFDWSPDGEKIVFNSNGEDLYLINQDGSGLERLTEMGTAYRPAWSPDGERIVFLSTQNDLSSVYIINSDGRELVQVTHDESLGFSCPQWLPNGEQIIVLGFPKDQIYSVQTDVYAIQPDGSGIMTRLTDDSGEESLSNCIGLFG